MRCRIRKGKLPLIPSFAPATAPSCACALTTTTRSSSIPTAPSTFSSNTAAAGDTATCTGQSDFGPAGRLAAVAAGDAAVAAGNATT